MHQEGQGIHPKIPYRPQRRGAKGEKQHGAAGHSHQHEQPQLTLGAVEGEKEQDPGADHAVQAVQRAGEPGQPQPEGPQQVVQHPQKGPQQDGLAEQQQLGGDVVLHTDSAEQPPEQTAALPAAVLIGDGVHPAVHMELPAVQGQLADVQFLPGDH